MKSILKKTPPSQIESEEEMPSPTNNLIDKQEKYAQTVRDIINRQYAPIADCTDVVCAAIEDWTTTSRRLVGSASAESGVNEAFDGFLGNSGLHHLLYCR